MDYLAVIVVGRRLGLGRLAAASLVVTAAPLSRGSVGGGGGNLDIDEEARRRARCALALFTLCLDQARANSMVPH
jgi:hypothetical protein